MAPKRVRSCAVALSDAQAKTLLEAHVRAADVCFERMFKYDKAGRKEAPGWKCLHKHRHFLTDLVLATRGRLLRQHAWERQVGEFVRAFDSRISWDEISAIADRPRIMLSHLWSMKRDRVEPRKNDMAIISLKDAMDVLPKPVASLDVGPSALEMVEEIRSSSDGESDVEVLAPLADVMVLEDSEEEDVDALYSTFFTTPSRPRKKASDITPELAGAPTVGLGHDAIADLVAAAKPHAAAPTAKDYKDTFKGDPKGKTGKKGKRKGKPVGKGKGKKGKGKSAKVKKVGKNGVVQKKPAAAPAAARAPADGTGLSRVLLLLLFVLLSLLILSYLSF